MEKSEVRKGDYIYEEYEGKIYIQKMHTDKDVSFFIRTNLGGKYVYSANSRLYGKIRYATPIEKFWLDECIKIGQFIGRDEIEKRFNGEIHYEVY